jgi:hypothetical protein
MKNKTDGLRKNNVPETGYLLKMELTPSPRIDHTLNGFDCVFTMATYTFKTLFMLVCFKVKHKKQYI